MIKVGLFGCGFITPANLHGYEVLIVKTIDVRIVALCARKIEIQKDSERLAQALLRENL
jgi:hypothetical protein